MTDRHPAREFHRQALDYAAMAKRGGTTDGHVRNLYGKAAEAERQAFARSGDLNPITRGTYASSLCWFIFKSGRPAAAKNEARRMLGDSTVTDQFARAQIARVLETPDDSTFA